MSDLRIRYGLAFGRQNNWVSGIAGQKGLLAGTDGLFAQASTAPDVTTGVLFYTANSAATTIASLQVNTPHTGTGNQSGLFEGKVVKIFFTDAYTTVSGPTLYLQDSNRTAFPANSWLGLIYHNSAWYETERSSYVEPAFGSTTVALGATNEILTVTNNDRLITLAGTEPLVTLSGISGGYVGQRIILVDGSGGCSIIVANTVGNIYMTGTGSFRISGISSAANINSVTLTKLGTGYGATSDQSVWAVDVPFKGNN